MSELLAEAAFAWAAALKVGILRFRPKTCLSGPANISIARPVNTLP
jgi:hypothetical protein